MTSGPLPHLETFARAAELGSFTAAARALGLTQAAVSQRIHLLEQELGVALFRRQGGRILLSEAGKCLYPYAQRIFALHEEARQQITGEARALVGELILAASSIPGEHLLPVLLSGFQRKYPHLQLRALITDSQGVLNQVEHGQAHLGLVGMRGDNPHLDFQPFASDQLVLIVPEGHAWARKRQISLRQLTEQPLILREAGSGSRRCLEQALAQAGKSVADLHVTLELGSNEAIKEAVLQGMGAAVLSLHAVRKEVEAGRLHALPVMGLSLKRDMFVVRDRRRVLPLPAQLFLHFLQAQVEPPPDQ